MPRYEYEYTNAEGTTKRVEQIHPISEYPREITVQEGDEIYRATLVISLTAKMASNWTVRDTASDLPPENAPVPGLS
jgi:hypothetical protein